MGINFSAPRSFDRPTFEFPAPFRNPLAAFPRTTEVLPATASRQEAIKILNRNNLPTPESDSSFFDTTTNTFVNAISALGDFLSIPKKIVFAFGKNLGELAIGREIGNDSFFEDLIKAATGDSEITMEDVFKSFDAEDIDFALPEELQIQSTTVRLGTAFVAGALGAFLGGPIGAIASFFVTNDALGGRNVPSSIADFVLDPANKLRILQLNPKFLGITRAQERSLKKAGLFEDAVIKLAKQAKRRGEIGKDIFSQVARGERHLFDFKGQSGLTLFGKKFKIVSETKAGQQIVEVIPDIGMIVPTGQVGLNIGKWVGADIFGDAFDLGTGAFGQTLRSIPFLGKSLEAAMKPLDLITGGIIRIGQKFEPYFTPSGKSAAGARQLIKSVEDGAIDDVFETDAVRKLRSGGKESEATVLKDQNKREFVEAVKEKDLSAAEGQEAFEAQINQMVQSRILQRTIFKNPIFRELKGLEIRRLGGIPTKTKLDADGNPVLDENGLPIIIADKQRILHEEAGIPTIKEVADASTGKQGRLMALARSGNLQAAEEIATAKQADAFITPRELAQDLRLAVRENVENVTALNEAQQKGLGLAKQLKTEKDALVKKQNKTGISDVEVQRLKNIETELETAARDIGLGSLRKVKVSITGLRKAFKEETAKLEGLEKAKEGFEEGSANLQSIRNQIEEQKLIVSDNLTRQNKIQKLLANQFDKLKTKQLGKEARERVTFVESATRKLTRNTAKLNRLAANIRQLEGRKKKTPFIQEQIDKRMAQRAELNRDNDLIRKNRDLSESFFKDRHFAKEISEIASDVDVRKSVEELKELNKREVQLKDSIIDLRNQRNKLKKSPKRVKQLTEKIDLEKAKLADTQDKLKAKERQRNILGEASLTFEQLGTVDIVELNALNQAMRIMIPGAAEKLKLVFTQATGTNFDGTSIDTAEAAFRIFDDPEGVKKVATMVVRLTKARRPDEFGRIYAGSVWDAGLVTDGDKEEFARIIKTTLEAGTPAELKEKFVERYAMGFNQKAISPDPETRKFFGRMLDKTRAVLHAFQDAFMPERFSDGKVQRAFERFIKDKDFLDNIPEVDDLATFRSIRKLIGKDGRVVDPIGFRTAMQEILQEMRSSGQLPEGANIRADLHGIAWEPMSFKDRAAYDDFMTLSSNVNLNIGKRSLIGDTPIIQLKEAISRDKELQEFLLKFDIISKEELALVTQSRFLEELNTVNHAARAVLLDISAAADVRQWDLLEKDVAQLLLNAATQNSNMRWVPYIKYIGDNLAFKNKTKQFKAAKDAVFNHMASITANSQLIADLNRTLKFAKNDQNAEMIVNLNKALIDLERRRDIKNISKVTNMMENLIDSGTLDDVHLNNVERSLLQARQVGDDGNPLLDSVMALRRLTGDKSDELVDFLTESGMEQLGTAPKGQLRQAFNEFLQEKRVSTSEELFNVEEVNKLAEIVGPNLSARVYTSGQELPADAKSLRGFVKYKAQKGATEAERALDGAFIPSMIADVIDGRRIDLHKNMNILGRAVQTAVNGINRQEANELAKRSAKKLSDFTGINFGKKAINNFERLYQSTNFRYMTSLFKAQAVLGVGFHIRNGVSSIATNVAHGLGVKAHIDGFTMLWKMSRATKARAILDEGNVRRFGQRRISALEKRASELEQAAGLPSSEEIELFNEMNRLGILGTKASGQLREEIGDPLSDAGKFLPTSLRFEPYRWNFRLGQSIEDWQRSTVYIDARRRLNMAPEEARNQVHLLHFNYGRAGLSDTEQRYMKQLIPFYSYFRLALARDTRLFLERTGEFNRLGLLVESVEKDIQPEEDVALARFIQENQGVRFRVNPKGKVEYLLLGEFLPMADLLEKTIGAKTTGEELLEPWEMVKNVARNFAQGLNPIIKVPVELGTNTDFYFGGSISKYEGQKGEWLGINMPREYVKIFQNIRFLNDVTKVMRTFRGLAGGVSDIRPDIPLPNTFDEAMRDLMGTIGGIKAVENARPETNRFFQQILPRRKAEQLFKREQRIGSINQVPALRNLLREMGFSPEQIERVIEQEFPDGRTRRKAQTGFQLPPL